MTLSTSLLELRNIERSLLEMQKTYGPRSALRVLRPVMQKASRPILGEVRALTPSDTGALRRSIRTSVSRPTKSDINNHTPGTVLVSRVGYVFRSTPENEAKLLSVEFGTSHIQAVMPLRRALMSKFASFDVIFRREFRLEFNRQSRILARKYDKARVIR